MASYVYKPGQPTKLTPEVMDSIAEDVFDGIPIQIIAGCHALARDTIYKWLRRGEEDLDLEVDSEYTQFFYKITVAERDRIKLLLARIAEGKSGWQGSAWILEKRWFKHFSGGQAELKQLEEQIDRLLEKFEKLKKSKSKIAKVTTE